MTKKIAPFLFVLLALAIYAPALRAGFVWDDRALVLGDPLIRSWRLTWEGFQHFLFVDAGLSEFYRPLQRLSYLLDYAAFIFSPAGYHLTSILWHAAAATALFFFAEELLGALAIAPGRSRLIAFLATIIWLVHPLQNAAVAYVSGRADPMAAAFGFCALFFGLRMLRAQGAVKWTFGFSCALSLLASALSKEMGLLFPLLWLLILFALRRRREMLCAGAIILAVFVVYLSLRLPARELAPHSTEEITPLLVRPILAARASAEYAGLILLPWNLHMDRDVATHPFGFVRASVDAAAWRELQTLLGVVLIAAALYALWRTRRRPEIFLPFALAVISYLPVSGLFPLNATVAEHWLYLPGAFFFLGAIATLDSLGALHSRAAIVCLTIWFLFLSGRTFLRSADWRDQRTFVTQTIAAGGDSARFFINLGSLELNENHLPAAGHALCEALAKDPGNPLALLNLAAVAIRQRDFAFARQALEKISSPPMIAAQAEESLAVLENRETGRVNLLRLRLAARTGPPNWGIEKRYIKALCDLGFPERAAVELKSCIVAASYRAESWQMMSELLRRLGRPNESALALAEAEMDDVHLRAHSAPAL